MPPTKRPLAVSPASKKYFCRPVAVIDNSDSAEHDELLVQWSYTKLEINILHLSTKN
jgi:hypothetical protein